MVCGQLALGARLTDERVELGEPARPCLGGVDPEIGFHFVVAVRRGVGPNDDASVAVDSGCVAGATIPGHERDRQEAPFDHVRGSPQGVQGINPVSSSIPCDPPPGASGPEMRTNTRLYDGLGQIKARAPRSAHDRPWGTERNESIPASAAA